ncbi:DUF2414 family protein [Rhizoctonia solani AG-3 Rhs1AP]|uniref:DUF2414 family protein n=2 Tax=Rhizoctonia solani AG-3 TaxID=1086053 RepID=A0A074RTW7_9AGAM|nr:DUF2414 family protein [Rhizoctonia solani AG-3 Rhs1AP]KEP48730.1 DUF2414 family protein [Rhizoctonia solani 123E]
MPMYADLLESGQPPALDFVLPYDQAQDAKAPNERLDEIEQLAEDLYGDGEKAPSSQRRVYTLEEYAPVLTGRLGKRKRQLDTVEEDDEHEDPEDDKLRPDALLLHGEPISKLSTEKIFEYVATYCDKPPISLEWIDDRSTVIIFESANVAKSAYAGLVKQTPEEPETLVHAHPVPKKMWPPEAQLDHNLSRGTALSGIMRIRWARFGDRKLKGARKRSEWYTATQRGKRPRGGDDDLDAELDEMKKRREAGDDDGDWEKERAAALDRELDALAARKDGDGEAMEVESASRLQSRLGPRKDNRQIAPLPRKRGRGRETREERPKQTQEDLDAELEAFMKARE